MQTQYRVTLAEKGDFEARLLEVRQSLDQENSVTEDRHRQNLVLREEIAALKGELATRHKSLGDLGAARARTETDKANLAKVLSDLRDQLQDIKFALEDSEDRVAAGDLQVADLRNQLDAVLAEQFDELAVFRSLLFNRLRESLVEGPGVRILGESVVLQSELLFPNASTAMREGAKAPLTTLARTLLSASRDAPIGLDWVLRVDGHTDSRPLREGPFESNWDLSAQRARVVVQYLAGQGVSPERLAAEARSRRPLEVHVVVPVRRLTMAWLRVPHVLNMGEYRALARVAWLGFLVLVLLVRGQSALSATSASALYLLRILSTYR